MKHLFLAVGLLAILWAGLSGCAPLAGDRALEQAAAPGHVLGLDQPFDGAHKTVTFDVVGKGLEPESALTKGEARLMAERAAVADGYRQLTEKVSGVYVDAYMKAGFGTINHEMVTTKAQSWLRGVEIKEIIAAKHGITEAHMQLSIYFTQKNMVWWPAGLGPGVRPTDDVEAARGILGTQSSGHY
ncbi:MAG: hypothetical protein MI747_01390 [Desulfobacterales bacterium]|nr:hypothetical protein [Desulfobacterales bacterium]